MAMEIRRTITSPDGSPAHDGQILCIAYNPLRREISTGSADTTIKTWLSETGDHVRTLAEHKGWVTGLAFATFPYDPSLRSQPPPRPPPFSDPDFKFSQGAAPAVALLCTHSDGRKSMQRVRVNRYTHSEGSGAAGNQAALLHALRMAGVGDVVSAVVDF